MKRVNTYRIVFIAIISVFATLLHNADVSYSSSSDLPINKKMIFFGPVIDSLLARGADTSFVNDLVSNSKTQFNEKLAKINVIKSSRKKPDYSSHYNSRSVRKTRSFIKENIAALTTCEAIYEVPKEVIASVLWIETKHGSYLGKTHVPSVYFSVAMAGSPEFYYQNLEYLRENHKGDSSELANLEEKLSTRTLDKTIWAIDNLVALESIDDYHNLYGSWAGAFGISQFLPDSYVRWAVDGDGDGTIDLFDTEDAIYSVGNYLDYHGWSDDREDQKLAVWYYNHSDAYVNAVLTLADKVS